MKSVKNWLRPIGFLFGLTIIILGVQKVFGTTYYQCYQNVRGFYEEPRDSLDAVYIGSSNVYAYFQAPVAWEEYGYTIFPWSVPDMPADAVKYVIEDAKKSQPSALYIVNLNMFRKKDLKIAVAQVHCLVDYMPLSITKVKLIQDLAGKMGMTGFDQLEFFLPLIRFHSGWSELTSGAFDHPLNHLKAASSYNDFLRSSADFAAAYQETEQRTPLTEKQNEALDELLTYCKDNSVQVLFIAAPQDLSNETQRTYLNTIVSFVEDRGFDVLDLSHSIDEIELDLTTDFYNERHTNVHGSLKFTSYLCGYLSENYDFEDKRGDPAYSSWDEAYTKYREILEPYALDFELAHADRDNSLSAPTLSTLSAVEQGFALTWEEVPGADGYSIYRKGPGTKAAWECIAEVEAGTVTYLDGAVETDKKYTYTVVPVKTRDGVTAYGRFDVSGLSTQ